MSHPTNSLLYDALLDSVPREHLKKLEAQGLSEIEILNRYKAGELEETLEEHERGKYSKEEMECGECDQSGNLHTSNCVAVN